MQSYCVISLAWGPCDLNGRWCVQNARVHVPRAAAQPEQGQEGAEGL